MLSVAGLVFCSVINSREVDPAALQELQEAVHPLLEASSYELRVRAVRARPLADDGDDGFLTFSTGLEVRALFERDEPVQCLTETLEAFRDDAYLVYRLRREAEPWRVTRVGTTTTAKTERPEGQETRESLPDELSVLTALRLPHALLADLPGRLASLRSSTREEDGARLYEVELKDGLPGVLVVTVSPGGELEGIEWNLRTKPVLASSEQVAPAHIASWSYVVERLNEVEVTVPEEVQKLLEQDEETRQPDRVRSKDQGGKQ